MTMKITPIYHSGFLAETAECYYLFDYYRGEIPSLDPDKPVFVFVSHGHKDHYNPEVFALLREMGMQDVTALLPNDIRAKRYPDIPDLKITKVYHSSEYHLPCRTDVQTILSTDAGVAYLVRCPEGVLFHAGDLNDWAMPNASETERRQMRGSFRAEINRLKGSSIDIAFFPLDPRLGDSYADGFLYFLDTIDVKQVYPMHFLDEPQIVDRFLAEYPQYHTRLVRYRE